MQRKAFSADIPKNIITEKYFCNSFHNFVFEFRLKCNEWYFTINRPQNSIDLSIDNILCEQNIP